MNRGFVCTLFSLFNLLTEFCLEPYILDFCRPWRLHEHANTQTKTRDTILMSNVKRVSSKLKVKASKKQPQKLFIFHNSTKNFVNFLFLQKIFFPPQKSHFFTYNPFSRKQGKSGIFVVVFCCLIVSHNINSHSHCMYKHTSKGAVLAWCVRVGKTVQKDFFVFFITKSLQSLRFLW